MNRIINTGNETVDKLGEMNFEGNIIPANWYKTVTRENGRPYLLAICILSEICYWYRPSLKKDEHTGRVVGYTKKFKGEMFQMNYQQFADNLGESKRSVKAAMDRLEKIGVIRREWKTVKLSNGMMLNNTLFIDLDADILRSLTFYETESGKDSRTDSDIEVCDTLPQNNVTGVSDDTTLLQNNVTGYTENDTQLQENVTDDTLDDDTLLQFFERPLTVMRETNTENITENTNENTTEINKSLRRNISTHPSYPISCSSDSENGQDRMERMDDTRELIKDNIEYDHLVDYGRFGGKDKLDELIEIMVEACVLEGDIEISGRKIPHALVQSRFEKYDMYTMEYVMRSLSNNTSEVHNIRKYLLATLYNAPLTMQNQVNLEIQHDMF